MDTATLRKEEWAALCAAVLLHLGLVAILLMQPDRDPPLPEPERMSVTLATEVGLQSTAPDPVAQSRAAEAPELSDIPAPPQPDMPQPESQTRPDPLPAPVQVATPAPQPRAKPSPAPRAKPSPAPRAKPSPAPSPRAATPSRTTPSRSSSKPRPTQRSGGSRVGSNFLEGAGSSASSNDTRVPAAQIGASARASLVQAMARQIKPHWQPPSGPEVEKIVTILSFRLNPDGSLAGKPVVRRQTGVNDVNRAQAARHAEQAIRAVQVAAPFDLPDNYYNAWKSVTFSFDWKLSQ
ncbi:MAG: energy transducer TonB [Sphingomonadaceae bacterium]